MKKIKLILLISACCFVLPGQAQNQDFYYLTNGETHPITKAEGRYLVEFPNESQQPQPIPGEKIGPTIYKVTDTSTLSSYGLPYYITPTYVGKGDDLNYTRDIVLQFKENTTTAAKDSLVANYNLTFVKSTPSYDMYKVGGDALQISKNIYLSGLVDYCHPDFWTIARSCAYIPTDPFFGKQWYLHNTAQGTNDGKSTTNDADIDAPEAWDISKGNASVAIAVIDEGITSNHYDLPNTRQIRLTGSNFAYPYDGSANANDPSPTVSTILGNNHGNACAGIIAATQDNDGVAGIAPLCKIIPIKVIFNTVGVPTSKYTDAIDFANMRSETKIINISWGFKVPIVSVQTAINNAVINGKLVVIAVGNTADHNAGNDGFPMFPGNIFNNEVITVAASDRDNKQANYSPHSDAIELAAPSHTAYPSQITGESTNIWTMDIPGTNYGYNPRIDNDLAPLPNIGEYMPISGANYHAYTGRMGGSSSAAPQVAGVAALMMSVNPCISARQVKDILQSTADKVGGYDYNWDKYLAGHPKEAGYSKELGYGKVNAYRAVKAAKDIYDTRVNDFLYIKDNQGDVGIVGTGGTGGGDKSPDIWVRNSPDGLLNWESENPEFTGGSSVYVYVRIRNRSCNAFAGTTTGYPVKLSLYWSKASSWSSWPGNWDGSSPFVGNKIGSSISIPAMAAGASVILQIPWAMLDPKLYKTWNSCLLARIENYTLDPITVYPGRLDIDVRENNNLAMRNLTIVDDKPGAPAPYGGRVLVGNIDNVSRVFNIGLHIPDYTAGTTPNITTEAEVRMTFDEAGWNLLAPTGVFDQQGIQILGNRQILLKEPNIELHNISFPADTRIPIDVQFNFLIDQQTNTTRYEYAVSQSFADTPDMVLGTETYMINKAIRAPFNAYAGADTTINKGDSTILVAQQIGDSAVYRWYDEQDSLLHTGTNYTVAPSANTQYKLELLSLVDGFKDYDEVAVWVRQHFISSISPNPATSQVTIAYDANNAATASIRMLQNNGTTYETISLNPNQTSISINTSNYPAALYNVVLICDGQTADTKTLQIN